ncbi:MAG TPA: DEAD/DEAH box helicase, partial [Pyrinomonadaceae bacterium]|nr:DEAD/DEAH box helicase [Pyrinomonadaceae bacterium]
MPGSSISLNTRILDLPNLGFGRMGLLTARKLAAGVAANSAATDSNHVTVEDLLHYLPMRYEDRSRLTRIGDLTEGLEASLELFVKLSGGKQVGGWRRSFRQRLYKFQISATDRERTGKDVLIWTFVSGLSAPKIIDSYEKRFTRGVRFIAFGRWEWDTKYQTYALRLNRPDEIEVLAPLGEELPEAGHDDEAPEAIHVGRRVPVYRKINDIRPKQLREFIHGLLSEISPESISETLPADLRKRQRLAGRANTLREIHFPQDNVSLAEYENARSAAHRRLIFEEFFWLALGLAVKRGKRLKESKAARVQIDEGIKRRIASVLPFKLTEAQRRVVKEIFRDLRSAAPMNRLLQGDVGSGKTIVALIAMLTAMENDLQCALMAPTEILAEQHARNIKRLLAASPYRIELLTGSLKSAEKKRLREAIAA